MNPKRNDNVSLKIILLVLLFLSFAMSFSDNYVTVDPNDGSIFCVHKKWWGLSKEYKEIFWMQADGYDYPAWMARAEDGNLYPFIVEDPIEREFNYR